MELSHRVVIDLSARVQRQTNKTASEMLSSCLKFKSLPSLKLFNKSITTIRLKLGETSLCATVIFLFYSIRYHGSSSSIKCHVYHHVGGRRHTPVVCTESREDHSSPYPSRPVTKKRVAVNRSNFSGRKDRERTF